MLFGLLPLRDQDHRQYIDILIVGLLFYYILVMDSFQQVLEGGRPLLAVISVLSWIRGIEFLRVFKGFRIILHLLFEIMWALRYYLFLLFAILVAFGISFTMVENCNIDEDFDYGIISQ